MKKYLAGLLGLALAAGAPLLGQSPAPIPTGPVGVPVGVPVGAPMMTCQDGAGCVPTHTVCVPEHYVKKTTKVVFSCGSEPLCLCYFRGLFAGHGHGCECSGHCEHPHTRRYLIKKVRTCEEDDIKCVPAQVPGCGRGHH
jgi:hypothetical protein